jgi:nucleotide-binding universal stress UspA family protein
VTHVPASLRSSYESPDDEAYAILAAIKPNDESNAALAMAQWLAEQEHRELHIVSVLETAPFVSSFAAGAPALPPFHDEAEQRAVKRALRAAYERAGHTASRYRIDVVEGTAAATIADIAREHDVRIVVVGKGTQGLLSHLMYGEQVMEIVRKTKRPVLVVPPGTSLPIERAMVAFDLSVASIRAAFAAHEMMEAGGHLALVHVVRPREVADNHVRASVRSSERRMRETLRHVTRTLQARGGGVTVEMKSLHGDPVDVLTSYAKTNAVQLLACGWHRHSLAERMFVRGHTVELLHRAECAVLVVPEAMEHEEDDDVA